MAKLDHNAVSQANSMDYRASSATDRDIGGIILSKLMRDREVLPRQIMLYRELVRAVFLGC